MKILGTLLTSWHVQLPSCTMREVALHAVMCLKGALDVGRPSRVSGSVITSSRLITLSPVLVDTLFPR